MSRRFCASGLVCLASVVLLAGCGGQVQADGRTTGPPPAEVVHEEDGGALQAERLGRFPVVTAGEHVAAPNLNVTGTVSSDVSRNIPVISLASGRVVEIHARIGDTVTKGQLLMRVQSSDLSQAFSDYRQAIADQTLARAQLARSKLLYEKGAVAQKDLEIAEDAEIKASVTVETATERLRLLGADVSRPSALVDIYAPVAGVITEQNVTAAAGVKTLDNSPNLFTISDLSNVWIICDVYENDLPFVHVGEFADVHLNAYSNRVLKARIGNIGPILDPNIRTAKVRLEVENPGMLRLGMFVTATFHGLDWQRRATVPATAVLHLHDRDWVYVPSESEGFRRVPVVGGSMLPGHLQEILSGIRPGEKVVTNALVLEGTLAQ